MIDLYCSDYVHFQPEDTTDPRDLYSARDKLVRCEKLLPRASRPPRLLDFGCGRGAFVRIARQLGYDADGVDPFLPEALIGEHLRRGSPESLETAAYDVVSLLNVAEHLPAPRATFAALRRALKPGGVLLVTCPYGDSMARRFYQESWSHMALDEHILFWTPDSLRRVLTPLGFAGPASHRILGAPFPYGKVPPAPAVTAAPPGERVPIARQPTTSRYYELQAHVWTLARTIQKNAALTARVRSAVDFTKLGDYLEYCVRVD